MAIAFGAGARLSLTGTTPFTASAVSVSGSNTYGLIGLWSTIAPTSITWNGVAMTQIKTFATVPENGLATAYIYGLAGVTTGDIVVNVGAGANVGDSTYVYYTGVAGGLDAATPVTNTNASATSLSTSLTPVADNCWVVLWGMARDVPGNGVSAGAGTTKRVVNTNDSNIFDNNAAIHPAASTTLIFTQTSASAMSSIMIALSPTASATTVPLKALLGVGI